MLLTATSASATSSMIAVAIAMLLLRAGRASVVDSVTGARRDCCCIVVAAQSIVHERHAIVDLGDDVETPHRVASRLTLSG